ncbi:MAG: glycosyltransferase [Bradyrhizobiaceae bacterium]|nr:glycosyltransferase [Bradyrhizobiaceae bacterium]
MNHHNVLILAYYFPPMGLSGVQRLSKFVSYLPDYGWQPYVVTTGPTPYYAEDQTLLAEVEASGATIFRTEPSKRAQRLLAAGPVKMPRERIRRTISKLSSALYVPDNKRHWAQKAMALAREVIAQHPIDVIFVSGPPFSIVMAGAQLSAETGIPFVADYRDLWYGNQFHSYPTLWHKHRHTQYEHQTLARASRITVTNRRMKEYLINTYKYLDFRDVVIIPHGWDANDFPADYRPAIQHNRSDAPFKLTFTGTFYDVVTPVPMFKAIRKLRKERPDMRIELHFAGMLRDEYKRKARRMKLDDVVIDHGYLPHKASVELLTQSDALWLMLGETRNVDSWAPAKFYEYTGTRKPILACVPDGALKQDAASYKASWITDPMDVPAIKEAVSNMYDRWLAGTLPTPDLTYVNSLQRQLQAQELGRTLATALRVV